MNLTPSEKELLLESLDLMEEHIFISWEAEMDIPIDTFNSRINKCESIRTKIKQL
jgi:hypothetical protein